MPDMVKVLARSKVGVPARRGMAPKGGESVRRGCETRQRGHRSALRGPMSLLVGSSRESGRWAKPPPALERLPHRVPACALTRWGLHGLGLAWRATRVSDGPVGPLLRFQIVILIRIRNHMRVGGTRRGTRKNQRMMMGQREIGRTSPNFRMLYE